MTKRFRAFGAIVLCLLMCAAGRNASGQVPAGGNQPAPPAPQPNAGNPPAPAGPALSRMVPETAARGAAVRIEAEKIPEGTKGATIVLVPLVASEPAPACARTGRDIASVDAVISSSGLAFAVPRLAPLGQQLVCVYLVGSDRALVLPSGSAPFRIQSAAPTITTVVPAAVYPNADTYAFWVDGTGFSPVADEHSLLVDGHVTRATFKFGRPVTPAAPARGTAPAAAPVPSIAERIKTSEPRLLLVEGVTLDDARRGTRRVKIRVGTEDSNELDVVFSARRRGYPQLLAIGSLAVLTGIIAGLIGIGPRALGTKRPKFFAALLLENGAYSLGKFQFYAWTAAAVLGYLFLAFSRSLVQGKLDLPDVPGGLPGIIGISAGTGVVAAAIGAISGTKGPAGTEPSVADFIMTGGSVVADRVQFLVWTIVTITVFLVLVATHDPATIETLPRIPDGLLWLMGLSAGGYLGGKFVRRPSPSITTVSGKIDDQKKELELVVEGRNLSKGVSLIINDVAIPPKQAGSTLYHEPIDASKPEPGSNNELFQEIKVKVQYGATPILTPGQDSFLTLVNPDGQSSKGKILVKTGTTVDTWSRPFRVL